MNKQLFFLVLLSFSFELNCIATENIHSFPHSLDGGKRERERDCTYDLLPMWFEFRREKFFLNTFTKTVNVRSLEKSSKLVQFYENLISTNFFFCAHSLSSIWNRSPMQFLFKNIPNLYMFERFIKCADLMIMYVFAVRCITITTRFRLSSL